MSSDTELLAQYVGTHSEEAFSELVKCHLTLVYSAALRQSNGDSAMAEDISQEVFAELAHNARQLISHPSLAGWLYMTVRNHAGNLRRSSQRRLKREEAAMAGNDPLLDKSPQETWKEIEPLLDDAMAELPGQDRLAIVLRFLEGKSLRDVGEVLHLNENTARMRVSRALEKLRALLVKRGVTSSTAAVTAALTLGAIVSPPAAFAGSVAAAALTTKVIASSTSLTLLKTMTLTKFQAAVVGMALLTGISIPLWQQARLQKATAEISRLQSERVANPPGATPVAAPELTTPESDTNELAQLREWKSKNEPELLRLRGLAGVARRAESEASQLRAQLQPQSGGMNPALGGAAMSDLMRGAAEQEMTNRIGRMSASLHLTPDQAQAITEILRKQAKVASAGVQQAFAGKVDKQELEKLAKEAGNTEEQIKDLLTPEQLANYKNYQTDEASYHARQGANMELLMMQSLNLSNEQQDQVFGALYQITFKQMTEHTSSPAFANSTEQVEWMSEQKVKALEPVLTPAQLATYRQQQELQLKFARQFLGKLEKPSGTAE